jgi:predicted TIM-barrel fold metal-dependent hydrolase
MGDWLDWIISVDDHVIEPPDVWQSRVPAKHRDAAPRWITDDAGEAWLYEGVRLPLPGIHSVAGTPRETWSPEPLSMGAIRPSSYDPKARVEDMDRDGVLAALCFPSFPRFCGQTFYEATDRELAMLCVQAYNDWMIDEWSGSMPGRFLPLMLIPLWDPVGAAVEMERCAGKGAKAVAFSENPAKLGLPSIHDAGRYWDPVFRTAEETGMPICTHIGSSSQLPQTAVDAPMISSITLSGLNAQATLVDWLYSGNLLRFPKLKLALSEGGISFVPGTLERVKRDLVRQGPWTRTSEVSGDLAKGEVTITVRDASASDEIDIYDFDPMEIYKRQIYNCMIPDYEGWAYLDELGTDNVMLETDFPHSDSSFPHSIDEVRRHIGHLSDEDRFKVQLGNACRVFGYELPAAVPEAVRPATV